MINNFIYLVKSYLPSSTRKKAGKIKRRLQGFFLKGNNVECPICGRTFSKFLRGGTVKRHNAVCPGCDSFERHRLLWLYIKDKVNSLSKEIRLLHFAPEDSLREKFLKTNKLNYVTTDLHESHVSINSDIQNLPFKENIFDIIICSHILEHVPDDKKGMKEIFRILNKDGWAILQVPINEDLEKTFEDTSIKSSVKRLKYFGQGDHVRVYGRDYYKRLEQAGFNVKQDNFVKTLPKEKIKRYCLMENEIICFVTRKVL